MGRLFRVAYPPDRGLYLTTIYPSALGSASDAGRLYSFRCRDLAVVHRMLMFSDPEYALRFRELAVEVRDRALVEPADDLERRIRRTEYVRGEVRKRGIQTKLDAVVALNPAGPG